MRKVWLIIIWCTVLFTGLALIMFQPRSWQCTTYGWGILAAYNQTTDTFLVINDGGVSVELWKRNRLIPERQFIMAMHTLPVQDILFSPDDAFLLTAGDDVAKLWDIQTGQLVHNFIGYTGQLDLSLADIDSAIKGVAFSHDGHTLVTGTLDGNVKIWDWRTGKLWRQFKFETLDSLTLSPDGRYILTGGRNITAILWDIQSGQPVRTFADHQMMINDVAFSPDGQHILMGSMDGTAKLWEIASRNVLHTFSDHHANVLDVAFSPDGQYILTGSMDGTAKLWNSTTGQVLHTFVGHTAGITSVAFSLNGKQIITGRRDASVKLWDVQSGREPHTFSENNVSVAVTSIAFAGDGKHLAAGYENGTVKLWELPTQQNVPIFENYSPIIHTFAYSSNGKYIITGEKNGTLRQWNLYTGQQQYLWTEQADSNYKLMLSPDGQTLLVEGKESELWDMRTKQRLHVFKSGTRSIRFLSDGHSIITFDAQEGIVRRNINDGSALENIIHIWNIVSALSPNAKFVITSAGDDFIQLWDTHSKQLLRGYWFWCS